MDNKPIFVASKPYSFFGNDKTIEELALLINKYDGERKVLHPCKQLYIHGGLEDKIGFDVAFIASGTVENVPIQDAILVDTNDVHHNAKLLHIVYIERITKREEEMLILVDENEAEKYKDKIKKQG